MYSRHMTFVDVHIHAYSCLIAVFPPSSLSAFVDLYASVPTKVLSIAIPSSAQWSAEEIEKLLGCAIQGCPELG